MLQTINGTLRQTNLPNESEDYLSKREELRLAEIELRNQRERVAELRRNLPKGAAVQDYIFEEVAASLDSGDSPIGLSFSISSCTAKNRQSHAQCAQPGSMVSTPSRITSRKTSFSRSSPQRIYPLCEVTLAGEAGADCVF
jgi:hypothetical protein